jgi:hypothetical protein
MAIAERYAVVLHGSPTETMACLTIVSITTIKASRTQRTEIMKLIMSRVFFGVIGAGLFILSGCPGMTDKLSELSKTVDVDKLSELIKTRDTTPPEAEAGADAPRAKPPTACQPSSPSNMVGKVASDIPGTPLQLCQTVTSVIDRNTRPVDVYSVQLQAGQSVRLRIQCNQNCSLNFWNPNTTRIANTLSAVHRVWSSNDREDSWGYTAAVSGTYPVSITTTGTHSPVRYTASVQPVQ